MPRPAKSAPAAGGIGPGTVAAAWGVRDRPGRGPRPALSLERIVAAAVRVADAEGLDAASMSRVAAELGAAPMSLYRHLASKEELLDLMVDGAWGPPPAAPVPGEGWRAGVARWAWAMRAAGAAHPWWVRIPVRSLPILPNAVGWFENALACLHGTGLTEARKASVIMLVSGYVRSVASIEAEVQAAVAASGLSPDEWMSSYPRMLTGLASAERYPELAAFIAAGVFDVSDPPEEEFTFGLDRILDGLQVLIGTG